jgi:hypothetical protein
MDIDTNVNTNIAYTIANVVETNNNSICCSGYCNEESVIALVENLSEIDKRKI